MTCYFYNETDLR